MFYIGSARFFIVAASVALDLHVLRYISNGLKKSVFRAIKNAKKKIFIFLSFHARGKSIYWVYT